MKKPTFILISALISFTSISQATPTHPLLDNKKPKALRPIPRIAETPKIIPPAARVVKLGEKDYELKGTHNGELQGSKDGALMNSNNKLGEKDYELKGTRDNKLQGSKDGVLMNSRDGKMQGAKGGAKGGSKGGRSSKK